MDQGEVGLFDNEDLNLTLLMEECAEVIQVCSKLKRFGWDDCYPDGGVSNKTRLEQELGDLSAIIHILTSNSDISAYNTYLNREKKLHKLKKYYRRLEG